MNKKLPVFYCIWMFFIVVVSFSQTNADLQVIYITSWDVAESNNNALRNPQGLDINPAGFIYIADTGNHKLVKLDQSGRQVTSIGGFGWENEQFDSPVSLFASNGLDVLVADYQNQRIERYDKDLHYLASFTSSSDWPDSKQFGYPLDVALSLQGELFCLDGENNRVLKLDITGTPQISFGDFDAGEGRLVDPKRLFIDRIGNVLVSDGNKIRVFDGLGNFLFSMGEGILNDPRDMCQSSDYIFIADAGSKSVIVLKYPGVLVGEIRFPAITGKNFQEPVSVACHKKYIYVLDSKRSRLDVFQWANTP